MPRTGRKQSSTGIYHVMLRGINRQMNTESPVHPIIAPESLASATIRPSSHYKFWTETWANFIAKGYFGNSWIGGAHYPLKDISTFNLIRIRIAQLQGLAMTKPRGFI